MQSYKRRIESCLNSPLKPICWFCLIFVSVTEQNVLRINQEEKTRYKKKWVGMLLITHKLRHRNCYKINVDINYQYS